MDLPDDETLTDIGLAPSNHGKLLIVACGALAREIRDVIEVNHLDHITLTCLPAILHNHPERIVPALEAVISESRASYEGIFVGYADCGTGGALEAMARRLDVGILPGAHCYAFFEGVDAFANRKETEFTAFYLTDFLARQFDAFVWKPLGLDKHPELKDQYFGHYEKVVYQAQTNDPKLVEAAKDAARRLELDFEYRFTGLGDLERELLKFADTGAG